MTKWSIAVLAWSAAASGAAESTLNHHLVRSARIGPAQTAGGRVRLTPWRDTDDVVEGWDWSLPPGVKPVERSGLIFPRSEKRSFPGNKLLNVTAFWRDVEPQEGRYDFTAIRKKLEDLPEGFVGCRFILYATVAYRLRKGKRDNIAPAWLAKHNIPVIDMTGMEGRFQLFSYPIWHAGYHKRYLRLIDALARSGIPRMPALRIVYVGAISKSWGEEMYIPKPVAIWCERNVALTPAALGKCLTDRLDAWARAFKGNEHKLAWVGAGRGGCRGEHDYQDVMARVMKHAYKLGMGQRCGFVENYLYELGNPYLGQRVDDHGYLSIDETCPPIAQVRAFGDENEEYGPYWTGRFGPLHTHPYRYHQSMIRALQMRRNYLWMSPSSVDMNPSLTAYVSLALGRRVTDSPDAFCCLRESTVRASFAGKKGKTTPIRNFERWLIQRDREGCRSVPAVKAAQHAMMWMVPAGHKHDWIARRGSRMGFALDDRFLHGGPHRVTVKVTYHDIGRGRWSLVYARPNGATGRKTIACRDTQKVFTATFHLDDACFPGKGDAFDFHLVADGPEATFSFVRVIKRPRIQKGAGPA